jgi:hypothetical protein
MRGQQVSWGTSQGTTHGRTVERRTKEFQLEGQQFNASDDQPYRIVESDKTGARAAHKVSTLQSD